MGEEAFEKKEKPKRKLTQKQLDALARGRARKNEKLKLKKEQAKEEKKAVEMRKEQRAVARNLRKEQEILEQIKIKEREAYKLKLKEDRKKKWEDSRCVALSKCTTEAQYNEVSKYLDKVEEDDFNDDEGIPKKFETIFKLK